jgi:hypothetical protein
MGSTVRGGLVGITNGVSGYFCHIKLSILERIFGQSLPFDGLEEWHQQNVYHSETRQQGGELCGTPVFGRGTRYSRPGYL